jgi:hypothetical protein
VPALAVTPVGIGRGLPVRVAKRYDRQLGLHDEKGQEPFAVGAHPRGQDDTRFGQSGSADSRGRDARQPVQQGLPAGLSNEDCDESRGVEDQTPSGP